MSEKDKSREEDAAPKAYDVRLVRRLVRYLLPYRLAVVGSIVLLCSWGRRWSWWGRGSP